MSPITREFQLFVKPVGAGCNLNCSYCYYLKNEFPGSSRKSPFMPDDVLEHYISGHLEAATEPLVMFSWHGGEPMLAGINFYRRAAEIQKKYRPDGVTIINGIQTNGTLINGEWCRFLAEEGFVVGISMDGPPDLHDHFRRTGRGEGTFNQVERGYGLLTAFGIHPEILCVVNAVNVKHPLRVYRFFREAGARYITFIPLVEPAPGSGEVVTNRSVPARAYGEFLCAIFDEWVEKDIGAVKIQIFEEAARSAFGQDHTLCIFKKRCGMVPVVEHNGDFYSCDHFVEPGTRLGNILHQRLHVLLDHPRQLAFGEAKEKSLPMYCRRCGVLGMCNGGCPKNRIISTPDGEPGLNYLCEGYQMFFNHCRPFVEAVSRQSS